MNPKPIIGMAALMATIRSWAVVGNGVTVDEFHRFESWKTLNIGLDLNVRGPCGADKSRRVNTAVMVSHKEVQIFVGVLFLPSDLVTEIPFPNMNIQIYIYTIHQASWVEGTLYALKVDLCIYI